MQYRDEYMPLVSPVDTVYYYYYDLRMAQLRNRNDFPLCCLCREGFGVLRYTLSIVYVIQKTCAYIIT